jgi:adenylate cyclase
MRCSSCSYENPAGARFCGSCGASLLTVCAACRAENPPGFRFCGSCGAPLEAPEAAPRAAEPLAGERRRVTVLFADLVGFSTLAEHLDPEELRTLMTATFAEPTEEVERREGFVEKFIGDAVVAVFGAPVTHEDDPARAVEAAAAMHELVRRRSDAAPSPLQLRVGVNSGLVVSGGVGDGTQTGIMGDAVNVAARLQQAADPGEVLLAASTWRRVRDSFEAERVGDLEVKGKSQPVEAYRLVGRREAARQFHAPFTGRREELALLELLWSSALKGNTHLVSVLGEPGVGKSRLLAEFQPHGCELDLRVICDDKRAFGPFLDLLERLLGGLPADADELVAKAAKLGVGEEEAHLLSPFLGLGEAPVVVRMADEQQRRQVLAGVWQFLVAVCRDRPTLIALDDVHWADGASRELLDFLLERLGAVPLMLVISYRPGFEQVERAELRASHTGIRLEPLSAAESVALACGYLGVDTLPEDLERLVATRAEGNPFFIEELLEALLELGSLAVVEGQVVLAKVALEVPDTVQGTILARVDRLDPRARSLLQNAAVLGRSFSHALLEGVAGDGDLSGTLEALARAQLLVPAGPDEWSFKHALIQEVTLETLLLRQRRELHRRVAQVLEGQSEDDPAVLDALAEHYAGAEDAEQARRYAVAAGDLAAERMGYVEALRRYQTALQLWGEGDEEGRLDLLLKIGRASMLAGEAPAARTALIETAERARELGRPLRAGAALALLGRVHWQLGEATRGREVLEQAIELLEGSRSSELVQVYVWASTAAMLSGRTAEAVELCERGIALAEQLGLDGFRSHLLNTLGASRVNGGDAAGLELVEQALELARAAGEPEALGRGYTNLSDNLTKLGRFREAVEVAAEGSEAMRRLGSPMFECFIAANGNWALTHLGRLEEAEAGSRRLGEERREVLGASGFTNTSISVVLALTRLGDYQRARAQADEAVPLARGVEGAEFLGQLLGTEAELEAARGNTAAARQALREALGLALEEKGAHVLPLLPLAARLLPAEEAARALEQARQLPAYSLGEAYAAEAEAILAGDADRFPAVADRYRALEMPYEEARCRISAGDLARAREVIETFGFGGGPSAMRSRTPSPRRPANLRRGRPSTLFEGGDQMRKLIAVWIGVSLAAGAGVAAAAYRQAPSQGKLVVQTQISFGCPGPLRDDGSSCNPWHAFAKAQFTVTRQATDGTPIPATRRLLVSDSLGHFLLALAPGKYWVQPLAQGRARSGPRVQARVSAGTVTRIVLRYYGYPRMV